MRSQNIRKVEQVKKFLVAGVSAIAVEIEGTGGGGVGCRDALGGRNQAIGLDSIELKTVTRLSPLIAKEKRT